MTLEPFSNYAFKELSVVGLARPGICRFPCCSQPFASSRAWQDYCSETCRRRDLAEMRTIGHRAAPALLAWQMGRYATKGSPLADLSRAGRNYYSALAASWLRDRRARAAAVSGREAG